MCALCLALVFLEAFISVLAQALTLAIFVRVIMSWVSLRLPFGLGEFVVAVTEPILGPIRRALPIAGGMDLSPIVAFLLIQVVQAILLRILPAAIPYSF
jgi:YggT family protein